MKIKLLLTLLALMVAPGWLAAQELAQTLQKLAASDVEAIAVFNLEKMKANEIVEPLSQLGFLEESNKQMLTGATTQLQADINQLKSAGVQRVFVILRMSDLVSQGTTLVAQVKPGVDSAKAFEAMRDSGSRMSVLRFDRLLFKHFAQSGQFVIAAASKEQLDNTRKMKGTGALPFEPKLLFSESIGFAMFGNADSRKVIRELMPELPTPLTELTGSMVADEIEWLGLTVNLFDKFDMNIHIRSERRSKDLARIIKGAMSSDLKSLGVPRNKLVQDLVSNVEVGESNGLVTLSFSKLLQNSERLGQALRPELSKIREAARQTQMMNNLRQVTLAMHNYESAYKSFPARANFDANGKALLSWRVHILPFIGENELYQQFKLDEPWDSEHNRKLVPRMPRVYQDTMGGGDTNNRLGKTVVQVPVGAGSIFSSDTPVKFRDMKDGSSNTILLVEVAQNKAVEWTRPMDWKVNPASPTDGLFSEGEATTAAALADSSVQRVSRKVDSKNLLKAITMDGGEVFRSHEVFTDRR